MGRALYALIRKLFIMPIQKEYPEKSICLRDGFCVGPDFNTSNIVFWLS